jgi:hypothetical protein
VKIQKEPLVLPFLFAGLLLARGISAADPAGNPPSSSAGQPVKELTRSAELVFRGTVRQTGAANLSIVEPSASTAIVRVDEVLKASGGLDDFTGRDVTVFLSEPASAGERRVFFTRVRLLGESLGAQEVGRAAGAVADVASQVQSARGEIVREDLAARLAAADLAVSGRVRSTRVALKGGPATEHDPQWREAVLEVRSVLKGRVAEKTVTFWYPGSLDVMWAQVPKPDAGQEGTWLLHRVPRDDGQSVYAVADPHDLLSADEARMAESLRPPR